MAILALDNSVDKLSLFIIQFATQQMGKGASFPTSIPEFEEIPAFR